MTSDLESRLEQAARIALCAASAAGSWLAGIAGASLVWNYMYSIGSSVIPDETYEQFEGTVTGWGGVMGILFGVATVLLLRRPAPGVLLTGHLLATVSGFFGGSIGWRVGLCAYFGTLLLLAFVVCVSCGRLRQARLPWKQ